MTILQDILAAVGWQTRVTENFRSVAPAGLYGINPATTGGLTLGYYGGQFNGATIGDGTVVLTASTTNYVVAHRTTGVVTASTGTTNWLNTGTYLQLYDLVAGTGSFTIATTSDKRQSIGGTGTGGAFTGGTLTTSLNEAPPVTISSATAPSAVAIGAAASNTIIVSGTTTITGFDTIAAGAIRRVRFSGALILTHNGTSLILPTSANITTADGDVATLESLGSGNWRVIDYARITGAAVAGAGSLVNFTESVNTTAPNGTIPVVRLIATNAGTNVDVALTPKGSGNMAAQIADNAASGGNKRGTFAVDWQMQRAAAASVSSGSGAGILAGNNNTASGANSVVCAGTSNVASNAGSGVLCGNLNTASTANYSAVVCGSTNTSSGLDSVVLNGDNNLANASYSAAMGARATTRAIVGAFAHSSSPSTSFVVGARQSIRLTMQADTTNATATALTTAGGAAAATNQFLLVSGSGLKARGQVVVRNAATGDCGWWDISGACKNVAGTVSLSGTPVISAYAGDASLNTCAVAIVADNTNKCLQVQATGIAATNLIWAAEACSVEIVS